MKWNFVNHPDGIEKQGIRDGDIDDFDKTRYQSVVRESIQNSLDAKIDNLKPVIIKFIFFSLNKNKQEKLFSIEKHIIACLDYNKEKDDIDRLNSMISSFEDNNVNCLCISDENTTGMSSGSYNAFISKNISHKSNQSSAGSKGRGKAAYFALSYLRTIIVSSKSDDGYIFQGISRLSNHKIDNQEKYFKGYFGNDLNPITTHENIPEIFRRKDNGTSINIIGIWNENEVNDIMIKAVLNHFWLSIYENELIVEIDNIIIDSESLEENLYKYFPRIDESGRYNENGNPRQYFETYCNGKKFISDLEGIGIVEFIILKNEAYNGRISHFRKSKMLIYKSSELYSGYCGIFICKGNRGNEILKKLENSTHTEWKKGNWNENQKEGKNTLDKIKDFKQKCIEEYYGANKESEFSISEFDNLISLFEKKPSINKPKPLPRTESPNPKLLNKYISDLISYVVKLDNNNRPIYHLEITSEKKINSFFLEILVATDSDNAKVNILNCQNHQFEKNILKLNLEKGINTLRFVLDDFLKHSIYYKQVSKNEI